jgi:hypothetical protein
MNKINFFLLATALISSPLMADYNAVIDGQQSGPYSIDQISEFNQSGKLSKDTLVWKDGMTDWAKASLQPDLQSVFKKVAPPPLPSSLPPALPIPDNETVTTVQSSDVNKINKMSDANAVLSSSDSIDEWADSVAVNFGREPGGFGEQEGKFLIFKSQAVSVKPTDPDYGDALINAFDKALTKVQEEYLLIRFGKTITDKTKEFFSDSSTNAKDLEFPKAAAPDFVEKLMDIFDKSLDVAGKKLDKELVELGVSPEEIAKTPEKVKKDLLRDKFIKNTIRTASGSIAGLFVVQTAVVTDKQGKTNVGVVSIASDKTIQIAKDIKMQRASLVTGASKEIKDYLPKANESFLHSFGTRLMYDMDGSPAIISYGLASYRNDSGDDYIDDELKSEAREEAVSNADAQIAELINGYMNVKNDRQRGEEINKFVEREVKPDSSTMEKTVKNIIKITNNNTKSSATAKLQGISTIKNWKYKSPEGHHFVGAVRVWKYSTLNAVNGFNKPELKTAESVQKASSYQQKEQYSRPVNSAADF